MSTEDTTSSKDKQKEEKEDEDEEEEEVRPYAERQIQHQAMLMRLQRAVVSMHIQMGKLQEQLRDVDRCLADLVDNIIMK